LGRWERGEAFGGELVRANRLFVGTFLEPAAATRTSDLAWGLPDREGLTSRPFSADRFHVTLMGIGDFEIIPGGLVEALIMRLDRVAARSFDVSFDRAVSFRRKEPRSKPLVLTCGDGVGALGQLHEAIGEALVSVGFPRLPKHSFTPHVTLLYDRRNVVDQPVEPISWRVRDFVLVQSLLGLTQHIPLKRWRLED
jgi:2'-5' RNA ligase